ncbi:MAG: ABC transporter ATP-binding protein [Stellaceae bacterium]
MSEPLLTARGLVKRYGGLLAIDDLSIDVRHGETHALIGPNGAGKTTLIGQLTGESRPDAGRVWFDGRDITAMPAFRRARLGLARSFQITSIFPMLTVLDNVALAVQVHAGHSFGFWRSARNDGRLRAPARQALRQVDLDGRADTVAGHLSHGEHRQLEIAIAIATEPRMLLLDEPMAGMAPEEGRRLVALLGQLKGSLAMLLVEHDMEAVYALADRISVMVYGRIIASGDADSIRGDAEVRRAYLGESEDVI